MRFGIPLALLALCTGSLVRAEDAANPPAANPPAATPPAGGATGTTPAAGSTSTPAADPPAGVSGGGGTVTGGKRANQLPPDQRNIARAIGALNQALKDLKNAQDDFGGSKADAIADCEKARDDLKTALQYRKDHPSDPNAAK